MNQVVAYNLTRARSLRGWTQERAAEELAPHLGRRWSKASFSAAERSVMGVRPKVFSADELLAFSRAFDLPVTFFLIPPGFGWPEIGTADVEEPYSAAEVLDRVFCLDSETRERLIGPSAITPAEVDRYKLASEERERLIGPGGIVGLSRQGMQALRRWADSFAELVHARERQIDAVLAVREELDKGD